VEAGADIEKKGIFDPYGDYDDPKQPSFRPLNVAIETNNLEIVALLIKKKVDSICQNDNIAITSGRGIADDDDRHEILDRRPLSMALKVGQEKISEEEVANKKIIDLLVKLNASHPEEWLTNNEELLSSCLLPYLKANGKLFDKETLIFLNFLYGDIEPENRLFESLTSEDLRVTTSLRLLKKVLLETLTTSPSPKRQKLPGIDLARIEAQINGIIAISISPKNNLSHLINLNLDLQTATFLAIALPEFIEVQNEKLDKKFFGEVNDNRNLRLNLSLAREIALGQFNYKSPGELLESEIFLSEGRGFCDSLMRFIQQPRSGLVKSLLELSLIPASKELFKIIVKNIQEKNSSQEPTSKQKTEDGKVATNLEIETPSPNIKNNLSGSAVSQHQGKITGDGCCGIS
jgi:hypothetical protein